MKITVSPLIKFTLQGVGVGIVVALYGSLLFSLALFAYGFIANSEFFFLDLEELSYTILAFVISALMVSLVSLVPSILAGIILSIWIYFDLKNGGSPMKITIIKGASLGFVFGFGVFAFAIWVYVNSPPHGILPPGGVINVIQNYAGTGIFGISVATLGGAWAGNKLAKFSQRYNTPL
jgi:hypothetical protein